MREDFDKGLIVELYGLTPEELIRAEKIYLRSSMSDCATGKVVLYKRKLGEIEENK